MMNKLLRLLIIPLLLLSMSQAYAIKLFSHFAESQHQLSTVNKNIDALKSDIAESQSKRGQLEAALKASETHISTSHTQLVRTRIKIKKTMKELNRAREKRTQLRKELAIQRKQLSQHITAAYMLGREPMIKLVLNQQHPTIIDRDIIYYRYLVKSRQNMIKQINSNMKKYYAIVNKIYKQERALENTQHQQLHERQRLSSAQKNRQRTIDALDKQILSKQQQLRKLIDNKSRLQKLVKLLNEQSYYFTPGKYFSSNKGLLPWPIKHFTIIQQFNAPLANGRLHSSGLILSAKTGTPIHAIFDGKVVFSDWLRGFGFLTIIQHGKHYMTLYARCQSLFVKQGQHVKPGQIIASVGDSGGYLHPALYFEIRLYSKAQNPLHWLRKH